MNFDDPFTGYSTLLRVIVYGLVPAFTILQYFRLKRALHVFQLEGYKRRRFLDWCRSNRDRALFLRPATTKKPLVMTGRATRLLACALLLTPLAVLVPAGLAHVGLGGWPADVLAYMGATAAVFFFTPHLLVGSDIVLAPLQRVINGRYLRRARARLREVRPLVIGITGSYGKTSTKFSIERLVGPPGTALATPGSFNTPLGVCRAINEQLRDEHGFFVVEMGAYGEGEVAELMEFVSPRIGVLTSIGPVHLERFGSMEAIRRGKYEVVRDLPRDGIAVMNVDDPEVRRWADETEHVRVVRYGLEPEGRPDITAAEIRVSNRGTGFTVVAGASRLPVETRLLGRHSIGHVLAGVAVGIEAGRPLAELSAPIASLEPVEHRLQLIDGAGGVTVIDDAFNSNPAGAAAALEVLQQMEARKRVVVTPGIVELGELQADANKRFARRAAEIADHLILVARINREALLEGAREGGAEVTVVDNLAQATERLAGLLGPGDVVLFENDLPDQYEG